jgi:hypothetical protein
MINLNTVRRIDSKLIKRSVKRFHCEDNQKFEEKEIVSAGHKGRAKGS